MSLGSAVSPDTANAPTTRDTPCRFCLLCLHPLGYPLPKITLGLGEDFRPFVTSMRYTSTSSPSIISSPCTSFVTCITGQISYQNRSEATGTAAENCHDLCPHFAHTPRKDATVLSTLFRGPGTHGEEDGKSHVVGQLVSSKLLMSFFKTFTAEPDFLALFEVFSPSS